MARRRVGKPSGMAEVPNTSLNDGNSIPQLGFGVFQIDPSETAKAVEHALAVGYRHIDTAEMYRNEREVGEGIRASGVDPAEIFVTSKLNNGYHEPDEARRAFDTTLSELGYDHVDLFLIHWPLPTLYDGDYVSTWKTLEEFKNDGRSRSIGVANGIKVEAWSPIAQGAVLDDAVINEIAGQLDRTPAQVVLRWHVQKDYI